jgi:hypothetical protein
MDQTPTMSWNISVNPKSVATPLMKTTLQPAARILAWLITVISLFVQSASAALITSVVETGGDNEATDTIVAQWTGTTFPVSVANEPVPGLVVGNTYTVGVFGNNSPTFVDRNHRYTHADPALAQLPGYLVGAEYIMNGNDNRDNPTMTMDVTVSRAVQVYLLIDNRLSDTDGATPPTFDAAHMQWVVDEGWAPVSTGVHHLRTAGAPDEVGIDEGADGTINQWYSVYTKTFPAGTFRLKQADNTGQNMYGAVVKAGQLPLPPLSVGLNFGADDNAAPLGLAAADVAGALPQANWNNLNGAAGNSSTIVADASGSAVPTTISVTWTSPNTWSSTGRGEENNGFPAGADRTLMTGYIDTGDTAASAATVTISGIPAEFSSGGYDVLVYGLGGVAGRGGAYTIGGETKFGTSPANPAVHSEDAGVGVTDTGTYVRFRGQFGSSFTLVASADPALGAGVNFRAPINGIQIVKNQNPNATLVTGYLQKRRYDNIGDSVLLADLLSNPKYINDQADVSCLRPDFSANDSDECDNCGFVVRGFFIPKVSGPHTFYISADDGAGLFLSTDENPANKVQIAAEPAWTSRRNYIGGDGDGTGIGRGDPPANISAPINLVAGNQYYIEGALKEAGGGDNLDVAVQGPGDPPVMDGDRPIYGERIATRVDLTGSALAITQNPVNARVPEGDVATFTVQAAAISPLCGGQTTYQWQRNGVDIPGATLPTYSFGPVLTEDHLSSYRVVVKIPGLTRTSAPAILEVLGRECLRVVGAVGSGDLMHVTVQFSTFIDQVSPGTVDPFSYTITGLDVGGVAIGGDGKSVTLLTSLQTENTEYTVEVTGVSSLVGSLTCDPPNNQASFRSWVSGPCNGVVFDVYRNLGGTAVSALTTAPTFPNNPDSTTLLPSFNAGVAFGDNFGDNYGGRMRGIFIPPVSGNYVFYLASDDASQLFLNRNGVSAAGKVMIQEETGCCNPYSSHASAPIALVAGQGAYLEALFKEGGGGDYCRVAVRLQGQPAPVGREEADAIPGSMLGIPAAPPGVGGVLTIAQQPASLTVVENRTATFTLGLSNPNDLPACVQWYRDGAAIPGANSLSYSLVATLADTGARFTVQASIIGSTAPLSDEAVLTVIEDVFPPVALSATGGFNLSNIVVRFDEPIDPSTAGDSFNYAVTGFSVVEVTLLPDGQSVLIRVDPALAPGNAYEVIVQSITDLVGNTLTPNPSTLSFRSFAQSCGFVLQELYFNTGGGVAVADLRASPIYPDAPSERRYKGSLQANTGDEFDNYGTRMSGWLIAPVTGNYNFFMSSDDGGEFWLSTDSSPVNKVLLASEPVWNGRREWLTTDRRNAAAPENRSSTLFPGGIPLVAGEMYYFEALMKEGGGGDNLAVAWQLPGDPLPAAGSPEISGAYIASLANPVGASVSISQQPVSQAVQNNTPTTFTVGVAALVGGQPAANVFYQWSRLTPGGAWTIIPGANSATYSLTATVADDGNKYRVAVYVPGATATSAEAGLEVNHCPTAGSQTVTADTGVPLPIPLVGSDLDGDALQFAIGQSAAQGQVVLQNSVAIYTSVAGYVGPDRFTYTVSDGGCVSSEGVINIDVRRLNQSPTAKITATPLADFTPEVPEKLLISCNGSNACLLLDGSLSSDVETPLAGLTFDWYLVNPAPVKFASGVLATTCLELGTHTIDLIVTDGGGATGSDSLTISVVSSGEAIEELISKVNESSVARKNKRPFIATLKAAAASAERGESEATANQLHAFQNKVRAQIGTDNPQDAETWTRWAQQVVDALGQCDE